MRKILALLAAVAALFSATSLIGPAEALAPTSITGQASLQVERNYKMGGLPAQATICIANGVGATYPQVEYVLERWNQPSYGALNVTVRNICTGYSITNRMTVEAYTDNTNVCGKYTNTHSTWSPSQGKYIYDQNPIFWINLNDLCSGSDTAKAHRFAMYAGYILGLDYTTATNKVMGTNSTAVNNVKYPTNADVTDMAGVYGLAA